MLQGTVPNSTSSSSHSTTPNTKQTQHLAASGLECQICKPVASQYRDCGMYAGRQKAPQAHQTEEHNMVSRMLQMQQPWPDPPAISRMVAFLSLDMSSALSLSAGAAISLVLLSSRLNVSFRNSRRDSSSASLVSLGGLANLCSAASQLSKVKSPSSGGTTKTVSMKERESKAHMKRVL